LSVVAIPPITIAVPPLLGGFEDAPPFFVVFYHVVDVLVILLKLFVQQIPRYLQAACHMLF
jgi:hypothetical protein